MANTRPCCTFDAQTGFPDPRLTHTQVSPDVAHASRCPVLSPTSRGRVSNQDVLSLFALRRTTGLEMDNCHIVSHTGSRQDHVSVKHFGVEGQLVFRVVYQVCTSDAFSSWTTMLSSLSLSLVRFDFVLGAMDSEDLPLNMDNCDELIPLLFLSRRLWIQRLPPLNISRAVHPQVVRTSRFNMDDCDELIPLWFGRGRCGFRGFFL